MKAEEFILASIVFVMLLPLLIPVFIFYFIIKYYGKDVEPNMDFSSIEHMTPYDFEYYVADLFKKKGYKTKITPKSQDYGVDVIARNDTETIAIQVKKYLRSPVGNKDVQMLLGAMQKSDIKADKSILITTSKFTKNAKIQARGCPIELWDKRKLINEVSQVSVNE
jgi:HJR/Mrr/RecB family endonuclease